MLFHKFVHFCFFTNFQLKPVLLIFYVLGKFEPETKKLSTKKCPFAEGRGFKFDCDKLNWGSFKLQNDLLLDKPYLF